MRFGVWLCTTMINGNRRDLEVEGITRVEIRENGVSGEMMYGGRKESERIEERSSTSLSTTPNMSGATTAAVTKIERKWKMEKREAHHQNQ